MVGDRRDCSTNLFQLLERAGMPFIHFLRHSAYVSRSKGGRFASMGEEDGAWRDEFFRSLELGLKTTERTLWVCRTMRDFHVSPFSDGPFVKYE
jgi:hypothetical protein